jgi:HD domain
MIFFDCLYGPIEIRSPLLKDLIAAPEFQRLRHVRMLNVDSPACKDLATASRYAHTIGVCFLAQYFSERQHLPLEQQNLLIAAAVLHDMGIPPFGHLIEHALDEYSPPFNHEELVEQIVNGTYAVENKYHQIYGGRSLRVADIFDRHKVDRQRVFRLLSGRTPTLIAGALDIDNLDNVLRMAALLGLGYPRDLALGTVSAFRLTETGHLDLSCVPVRHLEEWLRYRGACYEIMMFLEDNIAYSALLHDLARAAVHHEIVGRHNWFLTDDQLLDLLLADGRTRPLAQQLLKGITYRALASAKVSFQGDGGPVLARERRRLFAERLAEAADLVGIQSASVFVWYEYAKVSRRLPVAPDAREEPLGWTSSSAVASLVQTSGLAGGAHTVKRATVQWMALVRAIAPEFGRVADVVSIKGLTGISTQLRDNGEASQLSLF